MLWPDARPDVSPEELLFSEYRPPHADRPWMLVNMIASIDGAASDELGRSGGLGSAADRRLFLATRALADVIIAGATTVMAEDYGPPRVRAELRALREARGLAPRPRLAVVSGTLSLDPARRLFAEGGEPPIVLTGTAPDPDRRAALAAVAEVIECGTGAPGRVDWHRALAELRGRGYATAVMEGGPRSNGQLVVDDLIDELSLTVSPRLAGGGGPRIAHGPPVASMRAMRLARVLEEDGFLFLRYLRER